MTAGVIDGGAAATSRHRRDAIAISCLIDEARQVGYCLATAPRR